MLAASQGENRRAEYTRLFQRIPMYNAVAEEVQGRRIRVGSSHWVSDFASCNYLGLDLDPETGRSVSESIQRWGVHPSWCRLVASPRIYGEVEEALAQLIETETALILPTVTLISIGVIPALVGKSGVMMLDKSSHETMYEAAKIARDSGSLLLSYKQDDLSRLEELLKQHQENPRKLIIIDGVYSMSGDYPRLPEIIALAERYQAMLYVDDAHGFGVVGESPSAQRPLGERGNGIVKHLGCQYEQVLYVGGCSKAYSSLAAFVGCSARMKEFLQATATPYDLSGPCPTASLATLQQGLLINQERGELLRDRLWQLTQQTIHGLRELGFEVMNRTGFPIVSVWVGETESLISTGQSLFQDGVLVTAAPYPMVARGEECHRLTLTAANTEEEVEGLLRAFTRVKQQLLAAGRPISRTA